MVADRKLQNLDIDYIPTDWNSVSIEGIMIDISMGPFGSNIKVENFKRQGVPVLNGYNVKDVILNDTIANFVTPGKAASLKKAIASRGDIVITHRGTIGQISVIPDDSLYDKYVISQSQFRITLDRKKVDPLFLVYFFHSTKGQRILLEKKGHTGVPALAQPTTNFRKLSIALPSLPEQQAIAEALSDADGYIASIEKLIAKKKAIKQGAMQELLTGKLRLPGFDGEWVVKKIGEMAEIISGGTPSTTIQDFWNGNILWCTPTDITRANSKYLSKTERTISPEGLANSAATLLPIGSILLCSRATIGDMCITAQPISTNQGFKNLVCYEDVDNEFMYYFLTTKKQAMLELAVGSTFLEISKISLSGIGVCVPDSKNEQSAIAAIISDMDSEVEVLAAKLNKAKLIKQGMMHELLTGRIRLVHPEAATVVAMKPDVNVDATAASSAHKGHSQQFDDAVMIAGIVNAFSSERYPLGRKKVQKLLYLLRRKQDESTVAFKKKAAGPYADEVRYKGGEPIAKIRGYIATMTAKEKGTIFSQGKNIVQALAYIDRWGRQRDIEWLAEKFRYTSVDDLELLATVDMAICDLEEAGIDVSVPSIKHLIATNREWQAKLQKKTFVDSKIARAVSDLQGLL